MKHLSRQLVSLLMSLLLVFSFILPSVQAGGIEKGAGGLPSAETINELGDGVQQSDEDAPPATEQILEEQADRTGAEGGGKGTLTSRSKQTIPVKVRVESYNQTLLPVTEIDVAPYDITHAVGDNGIGNWYVENDETLAVHAIIKALEENGFDVADRNKFEFGEGNFITNVNGLEMNSVNPYFDGWMYFVNHEYAPVGVGQFELKANDEITLFFTTDYRTVKYSWFDRATVEVEANEEFTLTLQSEEAVQDAVILLDEEPLLIDGEEVRTNAKGEATLQFSEAGEYHLSAKRLDNKYSNITRPYSKVIVRPGKESPSEEIPDSTIEPEQKPDAKPEPQYRGVETLLGNMYTFYKGDRYNKTYFPWGIPEVGWMEVVALKAMEVNLDDGTVEKPNWLEKDPGLKPNERDTVHIRYIFGLLADGKDPSHAWETNRNLFAELAAQQNEDGSIGAINKHMWAMHALDTGEKLGYDVGDWDEDAKRKALDVLLADEKEGGGFAFSGNSADPDMTGMALLTLANYQDDSAAAAAIERAKQALRQKQLDTAGWSSWGTENSNSIATVISGLVAIGEDPLSDQWKKGDNTPLDALGSFQLENGAFTYTLDNFVGTNMMATEQSLLALLDIKNGKSVWQQFAPVQAPGPNPGQPSDPGNPNGPGSPTDEEKPSVPDTPTPPTAPSARTILFSVEKRTMGQGDIISPTRVSLQDGETAYTVLRRIASEQGISLESIGDGPTLYVQSIDGLGEFDGGPQSGWMYSVNGVFPQYSAGLYTLQDGDNLRWQYTKNLGVDLGNIWDPNDVPGGTVTPGNSGGSGNQGNTGNQGNSGGSTKPADTKPAPAVSTEVASKIESAIKGIQQKMLRDGVQSEWEAIGLSKSGMTIPSSYTVKFKETLEDQVLSKSGKGRMKITDVERLTLAAGVLGIDPRNVDGKGFNLIEKIYNSETRTTGEDSLTFQGNNGVIFALIALDSKQYAVPEGAKWTRDKLVKELLKTQKSDGSWSLEANTTGSTSVDITAMALTALAPYKEQQAVKQSIDHAVQYLSKAQGSTGGFQETFVGGISSEATAQLIIGLTANGIDPRSQAFTKNNSNLIDHLLSYRANDGGFKHLIEDNDSNGMSTEQALQALVAFNLYANGKGALYNFTENNVKPVPTPTPVPEPTPIAAQFKDVASHWSAEYIQQAVEQGLVKGYEDGTFKPNQSLTRAQAVSILVRALELETDKQNPFMDTQHYAKDTQADIAAAYHHGLIKGQDGKFRPTEKVTRAQMALLFYRAYEIQNGKKYAGQTKAPFSDMKKYNTEAKDAVDMLYALHMAAGENGKFMPGDSTSRGQATKMLIEFLNTK
ncbi:hypothetical protein HNO89_000462 [Sporosarcina luteola]|nr:hypothetical protein [Sporosarcina luteola]